MSKKKTSIGFKIIVYTTIIVSAWMILATLITLKIHWSEIPIGAMTIIQCTSLCTASLKILITSIAGLVMDFDN